MQKKIFEFLDEQSDFVVELQKNMTAIPAIGPDNGGDGEVKKAAYLMGVLKKMGFTEIREINAKDERVSDGLRPNMAARIPGKDPRTLWVIGHMDVVPPGDPRLWDSNPYELRQEGDLLYGRGVEDNQQAIVSGLLAAKAVLDLKLTPDYGLGVLLVADEETHSFYGLNHVVEKAPDLITRDDLVIIPDIGDKFGKYIEIAEKACLWMKITITGKQVHASVPDKGINTLLASSAAVLALDELHQLFPQRDDLFRPPHSTFVPSKKEANVENINTIPGRDVFYVDCRVLPGIDLNEILRKTEEIVSRAVEPYKAGYKVETVFMEKAPAATSLDAPVVRRLLASIKKLRKLEATPIGVGGQTVAAILRARDIPVAAWATILSNAHTPNEKSSIINTIADAKVIVDMLYD